MIPQKTYTVFSTNGFVVTWGVARGDSVDSDKHLDEQGQNTAEIVPADQNFVTSKSLKKKVFNLIKKILTDVSRY